MSSTTSLGQSAEIRSFLLDNFNQVPETKNRSKHEHASKKRAKNKPKSTIFNKLIKTGLISWAILFTIWTIAAHYNGPDFLPSPKLTFEGFKEILFNGVLLTDIKVSMLRVFLGWMRGLIIAIPLGLLIGQFKLVKGIVEPLINFFRFVPAIGFLTLFLMWFGIGEASKLALITYAVVFPVVINTIAGVNSIDKVKYQAAESLGAGKLRTFFTITIPGAVPGILTGVRLGLSGAIISIVAAEMLAANEGLGFLIYTSRLYYRTDLIFVGIFVLGIIGFLADKLIRLLAYKFFKYYGISK
ncbi:MAG: ABC transporter permease [Lachnospiraceae bacterium]|nr:ABC transporter permease [Lachnospiraceae bacterium]